MNKKVSSFGLKEEIKQKEKLYNSLMSNPLPSMDVMNNLGLYINRQSLSRILFMFELYQKILNTHGVIMEFGVRWGQNMVLFENFRGIFEPYNYTRKIIGFDTFKGFANVSEKDGDADFMVEGAYEVTKNYKEYLNNILDLHENESPISHIIKYELVEGNAVTRIDEYLEDNPHTIIALAYFDFDIYEPTKACIEKIKDRLTKGSVIGFDELCHPDFPGETMAVMESLGLPNIRLQRSSYNPTTSYIIVE